VLVHDSVQVGVELVLGVLVAFFGFGIGVVGVDARFERALVAAGFLVAGTGAGVH
jgi:hypothetical protein